MTSESTDSDFHIDFEDCNICLKYKYFTEITVQLHDPIAIHCVTSLFNSIEYLAQYPYLRRSRSVRRTTQVQWQSTQANSQQSHWTQKQNSQTFISAELLPQNQYLNALSSVTICIYLKCAEYKEFQWWASAVFDLAFEIPDSDFHFDFEDCNICLKSKYFTEITLQILVSIALYCVTSLHKSF